MILDCGKFEEIQVISCDSVNLMNEDNRVNIPKLSPKIATFID
jgi:hypothetical protein